MRNALAVGGLVVLLLIVGCQSAEEPPATAEEERPPVEAPAEETPVEEAPSEEPLPDETSTEEPLADEEPPATASPPPRAPASDVPRSAPPELPDFPWPPPRASTMMNIDDAALRNAGDSTTLGQVNDRLVQALDAAGYVEKSYFAVPDGFALVTRLEQIRPDGTPLDPPDRWSAVAGPLREFSLRAFLRALFTSNPGHFRILVFVATPHPFSQSDQEVSQEEATEWLNVGFNRLPDAMARQLYTRAYRMTALVYEFEQPESDDALLVTPGRLTARTHLARSGVLTAIGQEREDRP
ncbi:MAG: hypothetical protein GVY35_17765 [Bacteroidetes bacterium]|nr:hypothetical protein [Bacteroidota bacterium]